MSILFIVRLSQYVRALYEIFLEEEEEQDDDGHEYKQ